MAAVLATTGDNLLLQAHLDLGNVTGLGDKIDSAILLRLKHMFLIVLAGQNQHPRRRVHLRNPANDGKPLVGPVRVRGQAQIYQRQCRRVLHLIDQRKARLTIDGAFDPVFFAEHILQAVGDDGVIIDQ